MLKTILIALLFLSVIHAAEPHWVAVPAFEFTEKNVTAKGEESRTRVQLWKIHRDIAFHMLMPPQGFRQDMTAGQSTAGGKTFTIERRVWSRDKSKGFPNYDINTFTAEVAKDHLSPEFLVPCSGPDIPIPAGCIRMHCEPFPTGSGNPGTSVDLEWLRQENMQVGEKQIAVHIYRLQTTTGQGSMTGEVSVSPEFPGGLVRLVGQREDKRRGKMQGGYTLTAIRELPVPTGIEACDDGRFGFAAPTGYRRVPTPPAETIARWEGPDGAYLQVQRKEIAGGDLEKWWNAWMEKHMQDVGITIHGTAFSPNILGELTAGYFQEAGDLRKIYVIRNGQGYELTQHPYGDLPMDKADEVWSGWRWGSVP